ncbi:MAG: sigma-70 family RNA polymerase sigma factor [Polyangiales bacterium]
MAFPLRLTRAPTREDAALASALVRAELPRVERLLGRMLGPRHDLPDLVQSVFVEAMRAFAHYRGEGPPGAFVGGIAVQVARRAMRGSAYSRRKVELPASYHESLVSPEQGPEGAYAQRRALERLRVALERLKPKKRIAFCLWALEGLEMSEVAVLMDASLAATRSRITYAQRELRVHALRDPVLRELLGEPS